MPWKSAIFLGKISIWARIQWHRPISNFNFLFSHLNVREMPAVYPSRMNANLLLYCYCKIHLPHWPFLLLLLFRFLSLSYSWHLLCANSIALGSAKHWPVSILAGFNRWAWARHWHWDQEQLGTCVCESVSSEHKSSFVSCHILYRVDTTSAENALFSFLFR